MDEVDGFVHRVRVRYGEVDMQQVVFNSHYLAYCDDAMEAFVRERKADTAAHGWDFMLKKAVIEWSGSATVNDELAIAVAVGRWGHTSFDVTFSGSVVGRPVFAATITYVGVVRGTLDTMPAPAEIRAALG